MLTNTIPRIFLTRGVPGSGKTTWAKAMSSKYDNVVLVSLDDIRFLLWPDYQFGDSNKEKLVAESQFKIIKEAINVGKDIIVHNTNMNPQFILQFNKKFKQYAKISIVDFMNVDPEIAIENDANRVLTQPDRYVGPIVIRRFVKNWEKKSNHKVWKSFDILTPFEADTLLNTPQDVNVRSVYLPDTSLPDTIIIDIDGTLANIDHRSPFDHSKFHLDTLNHPIAKLSAAFSKTIILTGRDEEHRKITEDWLRDQGVYYEFLFMRPQGDVRPDYVVKKELFFEYISPYYNVQLVVEDRKQVVEMWRELGIICAQIDEGNF